MRASLLVVVLCACKFSGPAGTEIDGPVDPDAAPLDAALDAMPDARPPNSCGAGYVVVPGTGTQSTYRKVNTERNYDMAKTDCTNDGNGAHLFVPDTIEEGRKVYQLVAPDIAYPYIRAGVDDLANDGTWVTVLGVTLVNPPFEPNEPNNNGNCLLVGSGGRFADFGCDADHEYACECPP